jgi:excisionase family DNA binding protein
MMASISAHKIMTADEVAAYLRVDRMTFYRLMKRKELPGFKIGTDFKFRRADYRQVDHEKNDLLKES